VGYYVTMLEASVEYVVSFSVGGEGRETGEESFTA
jgi:hypothetical protein